MSKTCYVCDTVEGEFHEINCAVESCAKCGHSYAQCDHEGCGYLRLVWDSLESGYTTVDALQEDNTRIEVPISRRIYIHYEKSSHCDRCKKKNPHMLMYSDEVWEHYIEPRHQKDVICSECFTEIQVLVDAKVKRPDWCGFLWNPTPYHHVICTLPKGHKGRQHQAGGDAFFRHKGRVHGIIGKRRPNE